MNDTQENLSNEEVNSVAPVKLEWRRYGAHYKCDVNINDVVSYWCFACGNDYFVPMILTTLCKSNFLNSMKLEEAMNMINGWNNSLALCGYSAETWVNKSRKISQQGKEEV